MLVYQRVITINHSVMPFRSIKSNRIRSSNQASKQSSNQAIKQASNQSINQSIKQAINQSINLSLSLSDYFHLFHHGTKEETLFSTVKLHHDTMIHPTSSNSPPFGGTDDLHIATRQRGFQDVSRIHGPTVATAAGTHQGVDLVNHQNDVWIVTHFLSPKLRNQKKNAKKEFQKMATTCHKKETHVLRSKIFMAPQEWHQG